MKIITATIRTTMNIPDHTPALKIAPMASQLLKLKRTDSNKKFVVE